MQLIDQEAPHDFASDRNRVEHYHNSASEGGLGLAATCAESGVHSTNAKMLKEWTHSLNGSANQKKTRKGGRVGDPEINEFHHGR